MADTDIVSCLINRWIIDYECFELWRKFSDNLRVHQTWQLMFIEYLQELSLSNIYTILNVKRQDDLELINTLLIKLMNSISNASKLPPDNNTETLTPLEEALKYIDQLNESALKEPIKALLMKLKRVIRQECVVICFRCYKLKLGKTVYERVGFNSKEYSSKANLMAFFKEDVNVSNALESFSVSELTENCRKFFSKYFNILPVPFLIRSAEKMFDVYGTSLSMTSKKKKITSENSKSKHFLIHCWFAEYFSYLAWKNIDNLNSTKFDWLLKFVSENNLETKSCLLIRFMFKFNERKSMEDSMNSYLSPLELCLELLNKAEKLNFDDSDDSSVEALSTLRCLLKRHAVLLWCGKNLYERATVVFNRLFPYDDNTVDSNLQSSLQNVLKGHEQLSLDENKLEHSVKIYFSKVFANWQPHLLNVAENIEATVKQKAAKMLSDHGNMENKKRQRTTKKLPDDFISTDSIDEDGTGKKRRDLHRSLSSIDDEFNRKTYKEDTDSEDTDERRKKTYCKQRIWLEEEEELIYRGVKNYGTGNWTIIARNMLIQRSELEVRDKWRSMQRQGKINTYIQEIGPIPGLRFDAQTIEADI